MCVCVCVCVCTCVYDIQEHALSISRSTCTHTQNSRYLIFFYDDNLYITYIAEPPQLLAEPEDVFLAYPGRLARFSLRFTGTPQPTVQWYQITAGGSEIALHETGPSSRSVLDVRLNKLRTTHVILN